MRSYLRFLYFIAVIFASQTHFVSADRIKDLTSLAGIRSNQLVGYGVVVGLAGSGDGKTNTDGVIPVFGGFDIDTQAIQANNSVTSIAYAKAAAGDKTVIYAGFNK